jgi:CHAT domain-containing protein
LVEKKKNNLLQAHKFVEDGVRLAESIRSDLVSPESRAAFLATAQTTYQLYGEVLMREHQAEPTKGFDALAVEASERQRARSLLDLLSESRGDVRQGVDATLLDRERMLSQQLNDKAQRLAQANPGETTTLKQEISQLETDLERAQAAIRKASPRYAALTQPQPLKLKEIQQQLDADTVLLEYALGQEHSYLWAITKDSLTSYELPKGEEVKRSASQVYELLTARSTRNRGETLAERQARISQAEAKLQAASQELSQTLLAPAAAQLGNKRLVIVADGPLQYIPFAMLPEPKSQESGVGSRESKRNPDARLQTPDPRPPLIAGHEIISLPSASALAIQRTELAGRQPAPEMLAVIADPVFDRTDERFATPATQTNASAQPASIAVDDARSIEHLAANSGDTEGATNVRLVIPRLRFTRQEADQLLALTSKTSSFRATDFQASRATVLDPALGQYRYLHFATHGYLDSERPGLSALVFSMVDAQGKQQDGFLRANDIYNLKLPAELVVLSACQTGLGKDVKGEGLIGLTRGFMYAGAARVVVSLRNVNDKATADLMTKFYEKMLKQGQRPAAALRAAQVEMWKQKQWQSPYYWAAFTMQGEWR